MKAQQEVARLKRNQKTSIGSHHLQDEMKDDALNGTIFASADSVQQALKKTYTIQRQMINGRTPLVEIKKEFVYLFYKDSLFNHFVELVGTDEKSVMFSAFRENIYKNVRLYATVGQKEQRW